MKTLGEVLEGIEAFKADMEDLGVPVTVTVAPMPGGVTRGVAINLRALVKKELGEDLPELGNPHRRLDLWVKPHEEDLEAEG